MTSQNENVNIYSSREMTSPGLLKRELPINEKINTFVVESRETIRNILDKKDKRLLFVVGPCSIHNIEEAKNYASQLKHISDKLENCERCSSNNVGFTSISALLPPEFEMLLVEMLLSGRLANSIFGISTSIDFAAFAISDRNVPARGESGRISFAVDCHAIIASPISPF